MTQTNIKDNSKEALKEAVPLEEALNLAEIGKYNYTLLAICNLVILGSTLDIFSLGIVVPASACDLNLSVSQQGIITAMPFLGIVITSHFWGYMADTKGRRYILLCCLTGNFFCGILSSFSPNLATMAALRFVSSCFGAGTHSGVYTLIGECSPARTRSRFMLLMSCSFMLSAAVTSIIAYPLLPLNFSYPIDFLNISYTPWRLLTEILSVPAGLGVILIFTMYESPKFLANQNKEEEALYVLSSIYSINTGKSRESYPVKAILFEEEKSKDVENILHSVWQQTIPLFKPPLLKRTLQLFYVSMVNNITSSSFFMWVPFVVNLYVMGNEGGSNVNDFCTIIERAIAEQDYSNNTIATTENLKPVCQNKLQETTMITIIIMEVMVSLLNLSVSFVPSKKLSTMVIFAVSGVSHFLTNLSQNYTANVVFFLLCQAAGVGISLVSTFFVELYPTNIRGMATSLGIMAGRMCTFIGVTVIGITIKEHCATTIYVSGVLLCSSVVTVYFLPKANCTSKKVNDPPA